MKNYYIQVNREEDLLKKMNLKKEYINATKKLREISIELKKIADSISIILRISKPKVDIDGIIIETENY